MLGSAVPPYPKYAKTAGLSSEEDDGAHYNYNYLLNLPVVSFTQEKLDRLKEEADKFASICATLESQTELDLWNLDIDAFSHEYTTDMVAWATRNSLNTGGSAAARPAAGAPKEKIAIKAKA
jgi:DNA topoisomerase-2